VTPDEPFGLLVYRALKRHPDGNLVTMNLMYADIQKLKVADRAATLELFPKPSFAEVQTLKTAPPEQVVELYVGLAKEAAAAGRRGSSLWPFWVFSIFG